MMACKMSATGPADKKLGVTGITAGQPNFNQYAFVDVGAEIAKAEAEAAQNAVLSESIEFCIAGFKRETHTPTISI